MQDDQNGENQGVPAAGWVFKPGQSQTDVVTAPVSSVQSTQANIDQDDSIASWSASEYVANPKNSGWFMMLGFGTALLAIVIYLLTHDIVSIVAIVLLGIIVGAFAMHQPSTLNYLLDTNGLMIGPKYYSFANFKSFTVINEGAFNHVSLLPLKRFMPPITVHYPPDQEQQIIEALADRLPYEEPKRDLIDSISRKVRF